MTKSKYNGIRFTRRILQDLKIASWHFRDALRAIKREDIKYAVKAIQKGEYVIDKAVRRELKKKRNGDKPRKRR